MGERPDEIRKRIEETREQMSETVSAIQQKVNVPARVKGRIAGVKEEMGDTLDRARGVGKGNALYALLGVLILALTVAGLVLRTRWVRSRKGEPAL
ncbi:MAG: DUF3618 domain-containing protein [Actinobacteria bacterium]|nr:DUF3618 domain-containing protein [Actinomycetota bacterium]